MWAGGGGGGGTGRMTVLRFFRLRFVYCLSWFVCSSSWYHWLAMFSDRGSSSPSSILFYEACHMASDDTMFSAKEYRYYSYFSTKSYVWQLVRSTLWHCFSYITKTQLYIFDPL